MARTATVNVRLSDEQMSGLHARIDAVADKFKAVRDLHRPVKVATSGGASYSSTGTTTTAHVTYGLKCWCCSGDGMVLRWPCATADIVYTDDEITNLTTP